MHHVGTEVVEDPLEAPDRRRRDTEILITRQRHGRETDHLVAHVLLGGAFPPAEGAITSASCPCAAKCSRTRITECVTPVHLRKKGFGHYGYTHTPTVVRDSVFSATENRQNVKHQVTDCQRAGVVMGFVTPGDPLVVLETDPDDSTG